MREGVTVVCRVVTYELIQRFCEIKQRKLCMFLCVETRVRIVASIELLCEFRVENGVYCITKHLTSRSRILLRRKRCPATQEIPPNFT